MAVTSVSGTDGSAYLGTANEIGQRVLQEAIWHGNRCNWVGAEPREQSLINGHRGMTYRALGPELYSGTSGIALFLAELHAATGEIVARHTALGAIRQALSRVDVLPRSGRLGLYTGWLGIALAAARVGAVLGEEVLVEHATQLLQRCTLQKQDEREFDLLSGSAGAIAALVVLSNILDDTLLLDFAMRLGDELLQTANKSEVGYSWNSVNYPGQLALTGFSHGTSGVGYALLELFEVTHHSKYLEAAKQAFQYERHWFDADASNWPDLREKPARSGRDERPLSFATYWCHGAPGIALSRLRAYEILKNKACKAEARMCKTEAITALQTTREMIEGALRSGTENFSLCHGLAGNAEVLLYGRQVLGQERVGESALAFVVADAGTETYAKRGLPWPCGAGPGETASLLLGLAGIGYFYLRLHNPATSPILILERENFLYNSRC